MQIEITSDYITLGQLLKKVDLISSGGEAKVFLEDTLVWVNKEIERRRGRKLYHGDLIDITAFGKVQVISIEGGSSDAS